MRLIAILLILAAPATADEFLPFKSPSRNIHCMLSSGSFDGVRCDIFEKTPSFTTPPADCDLDWGYAFVVGGEGPGEVQCAGDTVAVPDSFVLPYGGSVGLAGVTCRSEPTGMTCTNADGHGFALARAKQSVF